MMAQPSLLIFFLWALRMVAFWLLHMQHVAVWLRLIPQAVQVQRRRTLLLSIRPKPLYGELFFSLYVASAALRHTQDRLRAQLLFGFALLFSARYGVAHAFFITHPTWLHAHATAM
jgi:hypothetical protein